MNCNNCGSYIYNSNDNYCNNCGANLRNNNIGENINNNKIIKDDSSTFLIIGIVLAMCCNLPFGAAVILINELKYKKQLSYGMINDAKKTKTIMICLIIAGLGIFIILQLLNLLLTISEIGVNTSGSYI